MSSKTRKFFCIQLRCESTIGSYWTDCMPTKTRIERTYWLIWPHGNWYCSESHDAHEWSDLVGLLALAISSSCIHPCRYCHENHPGSGWRCCATQAEHCISAAAATISGVEGPAFWILISPSIPSRFWSILFKWRAGVSWQYPDEPAWLFALAWTFVTEALVCLRRYLCDSKSLSQNLTN